MGRAAGLAVIAFAACGDNAPATITVTVYEEGPAFVAYSTPEDGWRKPDLKLGPNNELEYKLMAHSQYRFIATCVGASGDIEARELVADASDGDQSITARNGDALAGGCALPPVQDPGDDTPRVKVEADVLQPCEVCIHYWCDSSSTAPWHISAFVVPGSYDVLASNALFQRSPQIALRRDVDISQAMTLTPIDLDSEGIAPMHTPIALPSYIQPAGYETFVTAYTASSIADLGSTYDLTALSVPSSALRADDFETVQLLVGSSFFANGTLVASGYAAVDYHSSDAIEVPLPPPIKAYFQALADGARASWNVLPTDAYTTLELTSYGPNNASVHVVATKTAIDAADIHDLEFEPDVPGYDATWRPTWTTQPFGLAIENTLPTLDRFDQPTASYQTTTSPAN